MSKTLSESAAEILKASMNAHKDAAVKLPGEMDDLGGSTKEKPEGDDVGKKTAAGVGEAPNPGKSTVAGDKKMGSVKSANIAKPVVGNMNPSLGEETEETEEEETILEDSEEEETLPVVEAKHKDEDEKEMEMADDEDDKEERRRRSKRSLEEVNACQA